MKTHRLSGKAYKDLDSTIAIVIFYLLNDIIVVLIFTMVAEFEPLKVKYQCAHAINYKCVNWNKR